MSRDPAVRCPCLYSDAAPICRADAGALLVPSAEQLARYCRTSRYRRCDTFKGFIGALAQQPERWRSPRTVSPLDDLPTQTAPSRAVKGE